MFIQYISHELRNPLNAILLGADLMHRDVNHRMERHKVRQILEDILSSCHKSMEVLDELLSVETMNAGATLLARTLTSVTSLLADAMLPFGQQVHQTYLTTFHIALYSKL